MNEVSLQILAELQKLNASVSQLLEIARPKVTPARANSTCRACNQPIGWQRTAGGKATPVNPDGSAHWQTCPNADSFRKPKPVGRPHGA